MESASMTEMGGTDREQRAREYLGIARSLTKELDRAMRAISCNDLSEFEESLAEQENLTSRMTGLQTKLWGVKEVQSVTEQLMMDRELAEEIVSAHRELAGANRVYKAVLRHSIHSASLMTSLLDSFKGHFQEASGARLKYQTWSCQM
jgi:hypothetical protein